MILRDFIKAKDFLRDFPSEGGFVLREQMFKRPPLLTLELIGEVRRAIHKKYPSIGAVWRNAVVQKIVGERLSRKKFF